MRLLPGSGPIHNTHLTVPAIVHLLDLLRERKDASNMASAPSGDTISRITDWTGRPATTTPARKPTDDFGSLTFNEEVQRARLPKDVFRALRRAIAHT
jgi:hypothetical protein